MAVKNHITFYVFPHRRPLLTADRFPLTAHRLPQPQPYPYLFSSYLLRLTSYFLPLTSHVLLLTSYVTRIDPKIPKDYHFISFRAWGFSHETLYSFQDIGHLPLRAGGRGAAFLYGLLQSRLPLGRNRAVFRCRGLCLRADGENGEGFLCRVWRHDLHWPCRANRFLANDGVQELIQVVGSLFLKGVRWNFLRKVQPK